MNVVGGLSKSRRMFRWRRLGSPRRSGRWGLGEAVWEAQKVGELENHGFYVLPTSEGDVSFHFLSLFNKGWDYLFFFGAVAGGEVVGLRIFAVVLVFF